MESKNSNAKSLTLLLSLFVYLLVAPFLEELPFAGVVADLTLTGVLFIAVLAVRRRKIVKTIVAILFVLAVLPLWINMLFKTNIPLIVAYSLLLLFFSLVISSFFMRFFRARIVTRGTISSALCLYLLIGMFWGVAFALIDLIQPGTFGGTLLEDAPSLEMRLHGFVYFSFTTLTTLGYGDIYPNTLQSAALCQSEAIIGQFFTGVLIAQLVGIRVAQTMRKHTT